MKENSVEKFRYYLRKFVRELGKLNSMNCSREVTVVQCHALIELNRKKNCQVNDLADTLNLDKSTVSRTINGLVKNGQVKRVVPESDRRITLLSLTDKGRQTCKRLNNENNDFFIRALNSIPKSERVSFISNFALLAAKMEEMNFSED